MKNAPIAYSNVVVVPDVSANQPTSGMPARPARPVMTASARMAKRSSPSRVPVRSIVMADIVFLPVWLTTGSEADAATSNDGGSGLVMMESRQAAHPEVLDVGEAHRGDRERDRGEDAEFGQRQPAGHQHDGDEDREDDVSRKHTDADASDVRQAGSREQREAVNHQRGAADPLRSRRKTGQPRQRVGCHRDEQPDACAQGGVGAKGETQ